ncbi:hypothetical protein FPJ65_09575 [Mycobacterium tuberculosis]|nr:hypothetical protein FPJ65_09575 [Mycobacterium tuberculosis]
MTVVVVEWSAAEQAVLDRGVPVPAEPSISLRGDDGTAPGVDSGWPELSDPAAMMNLNRPGMSGDSSSWKGWGHVRWFIEEVPAGAA